MCTVSQYNAGGITRIAAVHTDWWVDAPCPQQGPQLAELRDGTLLYASSDDQTGTQDAYVALSADGGHTWTGKISLAPSLPNPRNPGLTVDEDGRVWAWLRKSAMESVLVTSDDGGRTWSSPRTLESPEGRLSSVVVRSQNGRTLLAGITKEGAIYVHDLSDG